jgi:quercetin dioxygenase-like cupin family protein
MSFLREGAWHDVDRGGVVFMPKNSVHTFKNIGDTPSRVLTGKSRSERIEAFALENGIHYVASL